MEKTLIALLFFVLLVASCAPVISPGVLDQVNRDVSVQQVMADPDMFQGKVVLVGGKIVNASVSEGKTWVEVLEQSLGWRQKPQESDVSHGRFLVFFDDFRDPEIYQKGRMITVAGQVEGKRVLLIDELEYTYPVLRVRESFLWKDESTGMPRFHFGIGIGGTF